MPAGCAGISGITRCTFDLNSGRFPRYHFIRGRLFHPAGVASIRSSFLSRWSVTIHIYVHAIRIPVLSIPRRVSESVSFAPLRSPEENRRETLEIRWKVRYFGECAAEFSGSGSSSSFLCLGLRD